MTYAVGSWEDTGRHGDRLAVLFGEEYPKSETEAYHAMLRGVNNQGFFKNWKIMIGL
jgi:hypothetical protein